MAKGRRPKPIEEDPYDFTKPRDISDDDLKEEDESLAIDYDGLDPDVKEMLSDMPEKDLRPYAARGIRKVTPKEFLDGDSLDDDDDDDANPARDDYDGFPEDDEKDEY